MAFLVADFNSSMLISWSSKNFSINPSSVSDIFSTIFALASSAVETNSSGISTSFGSVGLFPSSYIYAFISTRSIRPLYSASAPIGICKGTGLAFNLSLIVPTAKSKSAPSLSILFIKHILGTLCLSACLQTVSDCG